MGQNRKPPHSDGVQDNDHTGALPPEITIPKHNDIPVTSKTALSQLSDKQQVDYLETCERLLKWGLNLGKDPEHGDGYADATMRTRMYRFSQFCTFVWDEFDGYTMSLDHDHADRYMEELAYKDSGQDDKAARMKTLKMYFKWRAWQTDSEKWLWEPQITYTNDTGTSNPKEYLTKDERRKVREAALEYKSVPNYNALTPEERDEWAQYLSQRFSMEKEDVGPNEFERANSWKIPSLIWTALDTGFRPVEIERSRLSWLDLDNKVFRIPRDESSKNDDNWVVPVTDRTAAALERWLVERRHYGKYEGSDAIWLNRLGNPYKHYTLSDMLRGICREADIGLDNRSLSFYAIRHSTGTYVAREGGLGAAQAQLRHKDPRTTMRYDQAPVEDRRDALNQME